MDEKRMHKAWVMVKFKHQWMRWACRNTNWQLLDFRVLCWSRQALKMRAKCDQNLFGELLLSCKSKPHFVGTKVQFARTCNLYQTVMGSGVAIRLSFLQVAQPSTFGWHARKIKASHLNHHYRCRNSADFPHFPPPQAYPRGFGWNVSKLTGWTRKSSKSLWWAPTVM